PVGASAAPVIRGRVSRASSGPNRRGDVIAATTLFPAGLVNAGTCGTGTAALARRRWSIATYRLLPVAGGLVVLERAVAIGHPVIGGELLERIRRSRFQLLPRAGDHIAVLRRV